MSQHNSLSIVCIESHGVLNFLPLVKYISLACAASLHARSQQQIDDITEKS
jgi:hypothetical protein